VRCFHPIPAWQTESGDIVFVERGRIKRSLFLRCGQCIGCRVNRSREWAIRCMHEAQLHEHSVFATLTYNDDNNSNPSLNYDHFQRFMKRLRKWQPDKRYGMVDGKRKLLNPIRFYMCGEYGDQGGRRHFHVILFGCFFRDRRFYRDLPSGHRLYTSDVLANLWPMGFSSIGDVTFESAAYVARYVCKKVTGRNAEAHYERVDGDTGEIYSLEPEFSHMSLKPGIGAKWFAAYRREVFGLSGDLDRVVMDGQEFKPPRYYDNLLKSAVDFDSDMVEFLRYEKAKKFGKDSSPDRLAVLERCAEARLSFKKRSL